VHGRAEPGPGWSLWGDPLEDMSTRLADIALRLGAMTPGQRVLCAVAAGGATGAVLRAAVETNFGSDGAPGAFPWSTLAINVVGSLLLGALATLAVSMAWWVRPFLGTGVLGGFTTFSAYAAASSVLFLDGAVGAGVGYVVATPVVCVAAAALGAHLPTVLGLSQNAPPKAAGQE